MELLRIPTKADFEKLDNRLAARRLVEVVKKHEPEVEEAKRVKEEA